MNYRWNEAEKIDKDTDEQLLIYPPLVRQLLYSRGIRTHEAAESYFSHAVSDLLDPFSLVDSVSAAERIEIAIKKHEKIFIHGDFDADGLSATAILWEYLYRKRKADALPYIPSRVDEGYGVSEKSLEAIIEKGGLLVITVDCGVRDGELIARYRRSKKNSKGLDFIVTDHHQLGEALPKLIPFVHPLHPKGKYENRYLSGAAVAWKLVAAIEKMKNPKRFDFQTIPGIDLAGFATICDLMPLNGENRTLVSLALESIRTAPRPGLQAMMDEAGISANSVNTYDIGYVLGPRINASGRIGNPIDALRLLTTEKSDVARSIANTLGKLNRERQRQTDDLLQKVREQIEREGTGEHLYFAYGDDWGEGIIGLVAGKLQEYYHRPVVLVTSSKEGSRGSARSINGFNIVEAIGKFQELLVKHGGHDQAAGFTIEPDNVEKFKKLLQDHAREFITPDMLKKELTADIVVDAGQLDWELMDVLKRMEPYGYGNRKPVFWVINAVVVESRKLGDGSHLKLLVKGKSGEVLECIFFGAGKTVGSVLPGVSVDMMGNLEINEWNGEERLQFRLIDMKF